MKSNNTVTYLITRHPALADWIINEKNIIPDIEIDHWDGSIELKPNDIVIGVLPIHMIAEVCKVIGPNFIHLSLDVPFDLRGKELSIDEINLCNPRLQKFMVTEYPLE